MSQDVRIDATTRDHYGKGASRQYRRDGKVPAVVYGSGSEVRHVVLPAMSWPWPCGSLAWCSMSTSTAPPCWSHHVTFKRTRSAKPCFMST